MYKFLDTIKKDMTICIAPYNNLVKNLAEDIQKKYPLSNIIFYDRTKKNNKTFIAKDLLSIDIDIVLIISPAYGIEIKNNIKKYLKKTKIIFIKEKESKFVQINYFNMLKTNIIKKIKYFYKLKIIVIMKFFNIIIMMFIFLINSKIMYKFSWRDALPSKDGKDNNIEDSNIKDLYHLKIATNFKYKKQSYNIYTRGTQSYNTTDNDILINYPINSKNKYACFATADPNILKNYLNNKVNVIYTEIIIINQDGNERILNKLDSNINCKIITLYMRTNNDANYVTLGSGIATILSFYMLSTSINIFGYNHYFTKKQSEMNIFTFLIEIFFYRRDFKTYDCIEYSMYHLFFAYYFDKTPNINLNGNIDYFNNKQFDRIFTKKIKQIFLT